MVKTEDANVEMPNTSNTEVRNNTQANATYQVQPQTYAQTGVPEQTQSTQPKQPSTTKTTQELSLAPTTNEQAQTQTTYTPAVAQPTSSTVAVQMPSDFVDATVQGYINDYKYGVQINDYQAQINALNAIDQYRVSNGYEAIYKNSVYELNNLRNQKIANAIKDYENQLAYAMNNGDYAGAETISKELENYKTMVNYKAPEQNNSATYLGSVEYKSSYDSIISGIVNELLTMRFTYDPSDDEALAKAQEYATNTVYESMNAKGILDSTMTAQIVTSTVANLEETYRKMAKEEFYENLNRLQSIATFVIGLEETQYNRWLANVQLNLEYYEAQKAEKEYQWNRVNQLGYVDNEASIALGVPVGILSPAIRDAIQTSQAESEKKYNELYSDMALAEAKAQLELQVYEQKKAIDYYYENGGTINQNGTGNGNNSASGEITSNYKFKGDLSASALKEQLQLMYDESESDDIAEEMLIFARDNAKNYDAFVQAIGSQGYTVAEANKILNPSVEDTLANMSEEEKMDYLDSLFHSGELTYEEWKKKYQEQGLDYIPRTADYQTVWTEMGKSRSKEEEIMVLEFYKSQGLEKEIAERLEQELEKVYK